MRYRIRGQSRGRRTGNLPFVKADGCHVRRGDYHPAPVFYTWLLGENTEDKFISGVVTLCSAVKIDINVRLY